MLITLHIRSSCAAGYKACIVRNLNSHNPDTNFWNRVRPGFGIELEPRLPGLVGSNIRLMSPGECAGALLESSANDLLGGLALAG